MVKEGGGGGGADCDFWLPDDLFFPEIQHQKEEEEEEEESSDFFLFQPHKQQQGTHNNYKKRGCAASVISHSSTTAAAAPPTISHHHRIHPAQVAHLHYLRHQQQQLANALLWRRHVSNPLGLPRQQPHHPQPGTGMCAVFLPGTKKKSTGTGVFLPRRPDTPTLPPPPPPRNESASCVRVMLPARVVQALHLDLDELGAPPRYANGYLLRHDALIGRSKRRVVPVVPQKNQEISLPQEWTY